MTDQSTISSLEPVLVLADADLLLLDQSQGDGSFVTKKITSANVSAKFTSDATIAAASGASAFGRGPVISILGTPPASPATGARYLIPHSGSTGIWAAKGDQVVEWISGAWAYSGAPVDGEQIYVQSTQRRYKFNGSSSLWKQLSSKLVFSSEFATLALADAFAASAAMRLVIDENITLSGSTVLAAPSVHFLGGVITLGNSNLTLANWSGPASSPCFALTGSGRVSKGVGDKGGEKSVVNFGSVPNAVSASDGAVSASSTAFNSAGAAFTLADVGKYIGVNGAGAAGVPLKTTIAAYVDATHVTLTNAASTTVTAAVFTYGTDNSIALQNAADTGWPILINDGVHCGAFYLQNNAYSIRTESDNAVIKALAGSTRCVQTYLFGVRASSAPATFRIRGRITGLSVDIDDMLNSSSAYGIAIEDGYDLDISLVSVTDSLDEGSNRFGFVLGRAVYTSRISRSTFGRYAIKADSANFNFTTTVHFDTINSWHFRGEACQIIKWSMPIFQKDATKFSFGDGCTGITVVGGDFEGGGNLIEMDSALGCSAFAFSGNTHQSMYGNIFGTNGIPGASQFQDINLPRAPRPCTLTRSAAVCTIHVDATTLMADGTFKYRAPEVGERATITGDTAPGSVMNLTGAIVLSRNDAANTCTVACPNSGPTASTGTPIVQPDSSVGDRYSQLFSRFLTHDPVANRMFAAGRFILPPQIGIMGLAVTGSLDPADEVLLLSVDSLGRLQLGDGTNFKVINLNGNIANLLAGKGLTLLSPDGMTFKTLTIDNAGAPVWT